jgi:hypothetical protein
MKALRRNIFLILMILSLLALTGSDVECEDGDLEFDWPNIEILHPHGDVFWPDVIYVEPYWY